MISLTIHEVAHGYVALKMGDPTARNLGRLTLNPIKHIDIFGFLMLIFVGFGWAKPVPINPRNFKNYRKGIVLTSLAGPLSNFVMALGMALIQAVLYAILNASGYEYDASFTNSFLTSVFTFIGYFISLNVILMVFNLLPLPPLDGYRVLGVVLPYRIAYKLSQYERYSFIILYALLLTNVLTGPLIFLREKILDLIYFLVSLIPFL
jgi:Zn-dependent protease